MKAPGRSMVVDPRCPQFPKTDFTLTHHLLLRRTSPVILSRLKKIPVQLSSPLPDTCTPWTAREQLWQWRQSSP